MAQFTCALLSALALLNAVHGAPAAPSPSAGGNPPLRGSPDLAGYSPAHQLSNEDTDKIKYTLAPGQTDDASIGQYLDLENIENRQPVRGTKGGNDPGHRRFHNMERLDLG